MIAVIETGGKQYCVQPGRKVTVDHLNIAVGEKVTLPNLLGKDSVTAEVIEHIRADKVITRKFRNKTRTHKVKGHRQPMTVLQLAAADTSESSATPKSSSRAKKPKEA
jgi:large subunit ribosomal protein L21